MLVRGALPARPAQGHCEERAATKEPLFRRFPRELGGGHDVANLILLCDGCHASLHRGLITISGTSSSLVVERKHDVSYATAHVGTPADQSVRNSDTPPSAEGSSAHVGKPDRERLRADARAALVGLGYKAGEAGVAVDLAMRRGDAMTIEDVIRAALRSCDVHANRASERRNSWSPAASFRIWSSWPDGALASRSGPMTSTP
jgi:hypothetical protein